MTRATVAIDLSVLEENFRTIRDKVPHGVKMLCVVKADGTGDCCESWSGSRGNSTEGGGGRAQHIRENGREGHVPHGRNNGNAAEHAG